MKSIGLFTVLLFINFIAFAQSLDSLAQKGDQRLNQKLGKVDSIVHSNNIDTLSRSVNAKTTKANQKLDSVRAGFKTKVDSLQSVYQKPINQLEFASRILQSKIDSLHKLKLPTTKLTSKLDSINILKTKHLATLNNKLDQLKSKTTDQVKSLGLPKEAEEKVSSLTQSMQAYKIPMVDGKISGLNLAPVNLPKLQTPQGLVAPTIGQANLPVLNGVSGVGKLSTDVKGIASVTNQVGEYRKDIKELSKGNLNEAKELTKTAEKELLKQPGMENINTTKGEAEKYKKQLSGRPDSALMAKAKEEVKQQITKQATDHFAGKETILKEAMDKMSKLKSKYSEISSIADLPKRRSNPLKGKPLIERLIPALTLQFMSDRAVLVDINPSIAYKIYPKWKAGLGYTERITFDSWKATNNERVYGIRTYHEISLPKGFQVRGDVETLNAKIPPLLLGQPDAGRRDWEWNIIVGLKKDFKLYKLVMGNIQTMYRIWSDHEKAPYPDRLMIRMGFEFPMKKRKTKLQI